jgi:toxin ParE1/3/4
MTLAIVLRRIAQIEFDDAANFYDRRANRGLGFTLAVRRVLTQIADNPEFYSVIMDGVREALVTGYPYAIYYRILTDRVEVLAVFHTSRDPAVWQSRS